MGCFSSKYSCGYQSDLGKIQTIAALLTNLSAKSSKLNNSPGKKIVGEIMVKKRPLHNLMEVTETP